MRAVRIKLYGAALFVTEFRVISLQHFYCRRIMQGLCYLSFASLLLPVLVYSTLAAPNSAFYRVYTISAEVQDFIEEIPELVKKDIERHVKTEVTEQEGIIAILSNHGAIFQYKPCNRNAVSYNMLLSV